MLSPGFLFLQTREDVVLFSSMPRSTNTDLRAPLASAADVSARGSTAGCSQDASSSVFKAMKGEDASGVIENGVLKLTVPQDLLWFAVHLSHGIRLATATVVTSPLLCLTAWPMSKNI